LGKYTMAIKQKMLLILLSFAIIPMIFVGSLGFIYAKKELEIVRIAGLQSIADLKSKRIEDFFTVLKKDIIAVSDNLNIKKSISILDDSVGDFSNPVFKITRDELDSILKVKQKVYQYMPYMNVILLNPEGIIIYVLHKSHPLENLGNSLSDIEKKAFEEGKAGVFLSDIFMSTTKADKFSMLMTAPVRDIEEKFAGVIAFEINMDSVYQFIQERTGLGETGETLIAKKVGDAALFLNPLLHDPNATLQRKVVFGEKHAIPIQEALNGKDGYGLSIDYRGEKVIASWRYLPSIDWGIVVKIDVSEAFAPANVLRNFVIILVAAVLLIGTFVALSVSKSISNPIHSLQKGVKIIGSGNLDYKVSTNAKDEIGQLGKAFDQMTENLKTITASRDELEREVNERKQAEDALKKSEKRFRDLVENSLTGFSIIQDGQIVYQNLEQERLLGPLPRSSKLTDFESIHPDDVEKVKEFHQSITSGKVQTAITDFRFYPSGEIDGKLDMKWVFCRAILIEYQGKEAMLVNMMDITRAKELEHLLRIQDKMTSLGHVSAGIAHEIRNPLSGINIYLNTLRKIYNRPENVDKVKEILEQIQSASSKIESVIKRVMDFAKPSEPKFLATNINQPINKAIELSSVTLRKSGIKVEKALDKNLPPCNADPNLIEEVILNLITNADEAMKNKEGDKKIEVASSVKNNFILVRISDSGPGVPSNLRDKIFDPFYSTKNGSTGIGLSICHRIISDHGGTLSIARSKLGGAEFIIEIPLEKGTNER